MALFMLQKEGMPMIYDLQRASTWKRISAWLLDAILLCVAATLMAFILSAVLNYDSYTATLNERYSYFEAEYGVSHSLTQADIDAMSPEELSNLEAASQAISADEEALYAYQMIVQLIILITSFAILLAYLVMEFALPMIFGNGQTIGKKVFGLGVMRVEGVKVNGVCMFIRTVLGKYTIETMIPVMMALMLWFGSIGEVGWIIVAVILVAEAALLLTTRERAMIHDKLANTVTVDIASQMIFNSHEDLIAYKEKVAAEKAANQVY